MAINSIGSYGFDISSYYNKINQANRVKAVETLKKVQSRYYENTKESSVDKALKSNSVDFLKTYNKNMSEMMSASNSLRDVNSSGAINSISASTSNSEVADVKSSYRLRSTAEYDVNVKQLAEAQVNTSKALESKAAAASDANLSISTSKGKADINVSALKDDGTAKTNKELLNDVAKQINSSKDLGVSASVVEKDGKSTLEIKSKSTGEKNSFQVSGDFAESNKLSEASKAAQDAKYTVKSDGVEREFTSSKNEASIDYGKINLNLKKTGDVTVRAGLDADKITSAMDKLVNSYNKTLDFLNKNADRGNGVMRQIANMASSPASEKSMDMVGVSVNKDGTLSLDKDKLKESLKNNPDVSKQIIGGSFGIAQGVFNDARSGMTRDSGSLISNDLASLNEQKINDPFNFMNIYSSRGAYNVKNYYALGLMMNYLV